MTAPQEEEAPAAEAPAEASEETSTRAAPPPPAPSPPRHPLVEKLWGWLTDPNPLVVRELRATFRTAAFVRFLYITTGLTAMVVLGVGALAASGDVPPADVGRIVFNLYFSVTSFVIALIAPGYASTVITAEREQHTWESLVLSGMSPVRIVLGKFFAAYASSSLVLIAFSPVVGIAFLFGGVSPGQVVVGLLSMLVALAPAIAFGVAFSARLSSTKIAIILSWISYLPVALIMLFVLTLFGDIAHREWGIATQGPFFYTDALANRADEWDTWGLLLGGPLYAIGMPVWFLLASAIAGVQTSAENRVAGLKVWGMVAAVSTAFVGVLFVLLSPSAHDASRIALLVTVGLAVALGMMAFVYVNEPPLPPRPYSVAVERGSVLRKLMAVFGPGAAGTLRFALVLMTAMTAMFVVGVCAARHLVAPHSNASWDLAIFALGVGACLVACAFSAFATWLRCILRNGLVARALALAAFGLVAVFPFPISLIVDSTSLDDLSFNAPMMLTISGFYPGVVAVQIADTDAPLRVFGLMATLIFYGTPTVLFFFLVEFHVFRARRKAAASRAKQALTFAASAPVGWTGTRRSSVPPRASRPTPLSLHPDLVREKEVAKDPAVGTTSSKEVASEPGEPVSDEPRPNEESADDAPPSDPPRDPPDAP